MKKASGIVVGVIHAILAGGSFFVLFGLMFTLPSIDKQAIASGLVLSVIGFILALIPGSSLIANLAASIAGSFIVHALLFSAVFANASGPGSVYPVTLALYSILHLVFLNGGWALGHVAMLLRKRQNRS